MLRGRCLCRVCQRSSFESCNAVFFEKVRSRLFALVLLHFEGDCYEEGKDIKVALRCLSLFIKLGGWGVEKLLSWKSSNKVNTFQIAIQTGHYLRVSCSRTQPTKLLFD
jgi:hypothetical protein